jgi:hypothetical protein
MRQKLSETPKSFRQSGKFWASMELNVLQDLYEPAVELRPLNLLHFYINYNTFLIFMTLRTAKKDNTS